jgi:hypothetical protein
MLAQIKGFMRLEEDPLKERAPTTEPLATRLLKGDF